LGKGRAAGYLQRAKKILTIEFAGRLHQAFERQSEFDAARKIHRLIWACDKANQEVSVFRSELMSFEM